MNMKAIKFLKYMLLAVLPLVAASCEEEYTPGEQDRWDCQMMFFPQNQKTDFVLSPSSSAQTLTFVAQREVTNDEAEVPYILTASEEGIFSMESETIYFMEGAPQTQFKVSVSPECEPGVKYTCSIKVTDPQFVSAYSLSSSELTFSVTVVEWTKIVNNGSDKGLWRDDLFTSYGQMLGAILELPYMEKEVEVYERKDKPGYYRVANVYTPEYVSQIYAGDTSLAEDLKNYCLGGDLYINAIDPNKVYMETQFGFIDPFKNYGEVYFCSDVQENFDAGYSNSYGVMKNGVVEFKTKNSILLYLPSAGVATANLNGKTRLVLPGHKGYDYSVAVTPYPSVDGVMPIDFVLGADVKEVWYQVYEGSLTDVELVAKLEEVKAGNNVKKITASTTLDFTAPKTSFYTLVACSYAEGGVYQEYSYVRFGYDTKEDPRDVDFNMGLVVSDKYGALGQTSENSMEFYIYGKDIVDAKIAIYKSSSYEDFKSSIDSLVQFYTPSFDAMQLDLVNNEGYTGLIGNLVSGVEYTMIAYLDNGYHSGIFTTTASTEGVYSPLNDQFQMSDLPKELQPVQQEDYFKEWTLWSVDPFNTKTWARTDRGTVTFAEGTDLYFDKKGNPTLDKDIADPSKTMEIISMSGMFPTITKKYNIPGDAIDFHYYDGYIYTLMTGFNKVTEDGKDRYLPVTVDGKNAYPLTAYLYINPQDGQLYPMCDQNVMLGGFVRNPVDKESKDIIAMISSPNYNVEFLAMCMCWFEDEKYSTGGTLFDEEAHAYPLLINPESDWADGQIGNVQAPASCRVISNMLAKGQTNCVETADGFIKSTIDNFKALPYNYMENLTDVKVTFDKPVAEYQMKESTSARKSELDGRLPMVERVLR